MLTTLHRKNVSFCEAVKERALVFGVMNFRVP